MLQRRYDAGSVHTGVPVVVLSQMRVLAASVFIASQLLRAQAPYFSSIKPLDVPIDIPANRGAAALWQSLKKLHTRASLIMITAHPDDEDGGMLTYESRGKGTRVALLTLNRGEGGANVMSSDFFDGLGLVRTMELLEAGRYYGVDQYWTGMVDYGFSKTKEEALGRWSQERVLYDTVRVVRMVRPLVVTSVFVGGPSDGHGNHQVAGQMAADVMKAAGDPNIFPDQIKAGLRPWKPLKHYARVPFSRRGGAGQTLSTDVEIQSGDYDPLLGSSYVQLAREGLGLQKSQNGGPSVPQAGRQASAYHRFTPSVSASGKESSFFDGVDTSLMGILSLVPSGSAGALEPHLRAINAAVESALKEFNPMRPEAIASLLAHGLKATEAAIAASQSSSLDADAKYNVLHELTIKKAQFNNALVESLGVSVAANVTGDAPDNPMMAMFRGQPDTFRVALPGQKFGVKLHVANQSGVPLKLSRATLETPPGEGWKTTLAGEPNVDLGAQSAIDLRFEVQVSDAARYTRPYFTRPDIEQPYYDLTDERYRNLPLTPYPTAGWAELEFEGVSFRAGQVVQTTRRVTGLGSVSEPLFAGPAVSLAVQPRAGVVPLSAKTFPLTVLLRSQVKGEAKGKVRLELPAGWKSTPGEAEFTTASEGAEQTIHFEVTPGQVAEKPYQISATADYNGKAYREGYQLTGYPGLRPWFLYRPSTHKTSGVDVKVAPKLTIGYVTGSGDEVPEALSNLGLKANFLSSADLATGDLSKNDVILLGVRAYAAREDLKTSNNRLLDYVKNGGVVIVQYNTPEYDHNYGPYPYVMGNNPEEVTDEASKIEILDPSNPVFNWPNTITSKDFEGWVEERGSKFLQSWDSRYTPLLSTHDAGQEPQKGGLLFARYGKGIYVYNAYAFYRQLPEGVPGAYRIFANLISVGKAGVP